MNKFEQIIAREEIEIPRTAVEYVRWFEGKLELTKKYKENLRKQGLLHKGIAKDFYEELFPLYRLLQIKLNEWKQLKVIPKIGNQNYDVQVIADETEIPKFIEITTASLVDVNEHYRMECFEKNKHVDLYGEVEIQRKPA